jgi:glycosyltransferase involved in cell wall biosynthesis
MAEPSQQPASAGIESTVVSSVFRSIVHIGTIGGVAVSLAEEQRRRGYTVTAALCFDDMLHRQYGGMMINYSKFTAFRGEKKIHPLWWLDRRKMYNILEKSEIWHYHYPYGALKSDIESRVKGHKLMKHYHGDDIRNKHDDDYCLVATPDLLAFTPNGVWVPNPVDVDSVARFRRPFEPRKIPKVAHYPHYKNYGADLYPNYYNALYELEKEGKCQVVEVLRMEYSKALELVSQCDIVMGKILPSIGWFGRFELEGMALGKPVVTFVNDELFERYRPPVHRTRKETLKEDLQALLSDQDMQNKLSARGTKYVTEMHSTSRVCQLLDKCYARL